MDELGYSALHYFNWGDILREQNYLETDERALADGMATLKGTLPPLS